MTTTKQELEVKKQELVDEWERLDARYNRGFDRAGKFSELSQEAYMVSDGPKSILKRMREIDDEFTEVCRKLREYSE